MVVIDRGGIGDRGYPPYCPNFKKDTMYLIMSMVLCDKLKKFSIFLKEDIHNSYSTFTISINFTFKA